MYNFGGYDYDYHDFQKIYNEMYKKNEYLECYMISGSLLDSYIVLDGENVFVAIEKYKNEWSSVYEFKKHYKKIPLYIQKVIEALDDDNEDKARCLLYGMDYEED